MKNCDDVFTLRAELAQLRMDTLDFIAARNDAIQRAEQAEARVKEVQEAFGHFTNPGWEGREALETENERLRAALEMVEWLHDAAPRPGAEGECPWCLWRERHGHHPQCARQLALQREGEESESSTTD